MDYGAIEPRLPRGLDQQFQRAVILTEPTGKLRKVGLRKGTATGTCELVPKAIFDFSVADFVFSQGRAQKGFAVIPRIMQVVAFFRDRRNFERRKEQIAIVALHVLRPQRVQQRDNRVVFRRDSPGCQFIARPPVDDRAVGPQWPQEARCFAGNRDFSVRTARVTAVCDGGIARCRILHRTGGRGALLLFALLPIATRSGKPEQQQCDAD